MDTTRARARQHRIEDLWRLVHQAEAKQIHILCEPSTGEHFSTSATDPTILYRVSESGCSCKGFRAWHRCQHWALFLASLGRLPDAEPDTVIAEAPAPCRACRGSGFVRMTTGPGLADWVTAPCTACPGRPAPSSSPVAVCAA